jgi:outer membrane murein-binding lipoprotein Lpp
MASLLVVLASGNLPSTLLAATSEDKPVESFGTEIDQLKVKVEALEKESKEEAEAEHYEEAVQLLRTAKSLLAERESLFKELGRKASSSEELARLSRGLEENSAWRKQIKEMLNLLKLAL